MKWVLISATAILVVLHQDWWNWDIVDPRIFGFLPIGLAYQAMYSIACVLLMWAMVCFLWPKHLERYEQPPSGATAREQHR